MAVSLSITSALRKQGMKGIRQASQDYRKVAVQQKRALARSVRAGRTLAAKVIRAGTRYRSRDIKQRIKGKVHSGLKVGLRTTRRPFPVLVASFRKRDQRVRVRRWPTSTGVQSKAFEPARRTSDGRYLILKRSRWHRLKSQSIARVWVGKMGKDIQVRMRDVYDRTMSTWIRGVRRRAGARTA